MPGRHQQCLNVGKGHHHFLQRIALPSLLRILPPPAGTTQNFSLPCCVLVTIETEARRNSKDASTELAPESGEGRRKVRRKRPANGRGKPIFIGQNPQTHMSARAREVIKMKPGKWKGWWGTGAYDPLNSIHSHTQLCGNRSPEPPSPPIFSRKARNQDFSLFEIPSF